MQATWRKLGCVWGDFLGVWLWGQGLPWCLHQSFSLCTLDQKHHQIVILETSEQTVFQGSDEKLLTSTFTCKPDDNPEGEIRVPCYLLIEIVYPLLILRTCEILVQIPQYYL